MKENVSYENFTKGSDSDYMRKTWKNAIKEKTEAQRVRNINREIAPHLFNANNFLHYLANFKGSRAYF